MNSPAGLRQRIGIASALCVRPALVDAVPQPDPRIPLPPVPVEGAPPDPVGLPAGCAYHPRCPHRFAPCADRIPPLESVNGDHRVACWLNPGAGLGTETPPSE